MDSGADGAVFTPARRNDRESDGGLTETHKKEDDVDYAKDDRYPCKLGISELTGDNSGGDQPKVVTTVEQKKFGFLNERRGKDITEMETIGLSITDPKRRRVDDPITERLINNSTTEDDVMIESLVKKVIMIQKTCYWRVLQGRSATHYECFELELPRDWAPLFGSLKTWYVNKSPCLFSYGKLLEGKIEWIGLEGN